MFRFAALGYPIENWNYVSVEKLNSLFSIAKSSYDSGAIPLTEIHAAACHALSLIRNVTSRAQGKLGAKEYNIFHIENIYSRPILKSLFISDPELFTSKWNQLLNSFVPAEHRSSLDSLTIDQVLYTSLGSFAVCYDLWKPSSRKTPGTFFEILIGSIIACLLPDFKRTKHVAFGNEEEESISTDIVFSKDGGKNGLILPVKITTRERIVQPFAHQRICDSVFGEESFSSVLICMSELQRNKDIGVNEICVPGTIKLFQKHLAQLSGMYYLDPPTRYLAESVTSVIKVGSLGSFLTSALPELALLKPKAIQAAQ